MPVSPTIAPMIPFPLERLFCYDPITAAHHRGWYSLGRSGLVGGALLRNRPVGVPLVTRLKAGVLDEEIRWWAGQLAFLAQALGHGATLVGAPPSSEKHGAIYHLATELAQYVATDLGLPYARLYRNLAIRGHKAVMPEKLREERRFEYSGPATYGRLLIVDDMFTTGRTLRECIRVSPASICAVVLSVH